MELKELSRKRLKEAGVTAEDLWAGGRDRAEWAETRRIGCAEYVSETNVILLHNERYPYEIDLDRCTNAKELTDWLFHLLGKRWCHGEMLSEFLRCLEYAIEERHGRDIYDYFEIHGE